MAVPEQIKEITVTKAIIGAGFVEALPADPDRILLAIHSYDSGSWYHTINSTAPTHIDQMIKHAGGEESIVFTTHVPTEAVHIKVEDDSATFWFEHASRSSTT